MSISIAIAAKGNNEVQETENSVVNNLETEYEDQELVVDPTSKTSTTVETQNTVIEDVENIVANVVE